MLVVGDAGVLTGQLPTRALRIALLFLYRVDGQRIFEAFLGWTETAADFLIDKTYSPRLQRQVLLILLSTLIRPPYHCSVALWFIPQQSTTMDPLFALMWIAGAACAYRCRSTRLSSIGPLPYCYLASQA